MENCFFNEGVNSELDDLQKKIDSSKDFMKNLVSVLEKLIDDKVYFKKQNKNTSLINLKYNERDGHYLILTTRRFKLLNKKLSKMKKLSVGEFKLNVSDSV